ncbi:hypothetical protein EON63_07355 [archaeon]|nr:MAG: hypothetical protein EON63_07355 [archaeon]
MNDDDTCVVDLCLIDMGKARLLDAHSQPLMQANSVSQAEGDFANMSMESSFDDTAGMLDMHMHALTHPFTHVPAPIVLQAPEPHPSPLQLSSHVRLRYQGNTLPNYCSYKKEVVHVGLGWRGEVDCLCVADCIHQLLYKQPLQIHRVRKPDNNAASKLHAYHLTHVSTLRRYWAKEIWSRVFHDLLNIGVKSRVEEREEGVSGIYGQETAIMLWELQDILHKQIMKNKECALQVGIVAPAHYSRISID